MSEADSESSTFLHGYDRLKASRRARPSWSYQPSTCCPRTPHGGQLAFHGSLHTVRALTPGNGFGKSATAGHEANAWLCHNNRWQTTPAWPVSCIWFGPGLSQWNKIRMELLETCCLDQPYRYLSSPQSGGPAYVKPDGSRLEFRSYDAGWNVEQGSNPDIAFFDELPPWALFTEMRMRRRGRRMTRFVIAATQTMGSSWMEDVLYRPWLKFHADLGLSEEEAMQAQRHPATWFWPIGGIRDNPSITAENVREFEEDIVFSSPAEREVRLRGGFGDWSGASVFDLPGVRWLQAQAAAERAAMAAKGEKYVTENGTMIERVAA